ncbi:cysteine hydrolase [Xanthomonas sp. AmX2]|uniref:isochorismatase family cysteine hydrolase n=1 Tax=Xanthomonas sp. TaxID=29446 RepID=UPI00197FB6C7|nr:isochorismatase family cysteine hydrolase [Xanthomonas sp.]MBN6150202.1 cysteine hydrolase [Xanthomonas sp.]
MTSERPGKSALLIVDMINMFDFPEAPALAPAAVAAARQIARLRQAFQSRRAPVIYANDNFAHWQSDFSELVAMCCGAGGPAQTVAELVKPGNQDYFVLKPKHSAFLATPLAILLAKLEVGTLYVTGMSAESCVLATVIDAKAREYRVRVVRDAVAGSEGGMRSALQAITASKAGEVLSARAAIAALSRSR